MAAMAAALPRVAIAQPAGSRTLVFVPQANLTSLDPVWTTATVTRNYAYLVFDTLYGTDDALKPRRQMAEGEQVEDDGKRWTIRLREGLKFHDGTPVLARDCVASLQRWSKRDPLGGSVAAITDALEAPDDRTIVFRLKRPFPPLLSALAKTQPSPAMIMPERIARTDPFKQITEVVGSGPFRWVPDEYVAGSRAVFAKFADYRPREDEPSSVAGAKRVYMDRVEWRIIPEAATAANALAAGEIDWLEMPIPDLIPMLKRDRGVVVGRLDPYGLYPVLRFNHLQGPTTNRGLRQAILAAMDSREVMQAVMGEDASTYNAPVGAFLPGTPYANQAAMDRLGPKPVAEVQAMLKASGYSGEKVVLLHPTDQPFYDAMSQVAAATLQKVGVNVDDQSMDWGTVVQRRTSKEPLDKGGWSLFCTSFPALDYTDPLAAPGLRGNGGAAWYGWPTDPKIEALRQEFIDAQDEAGRKRAAEAIQAEAFTEAMYVPLGQYFQSAAWRKNVTGQLKGQPPLFWNVKKG
ncbi:MAG TPA: ABC transporter substrate-binding protein [Acetobacteraceae bacterium]|nr:ABC transporter substrate-binding protein [Acetobacteraceae bacterium]